jgi:hypothetical protein
LEKTTISAIDGEQLKVSIRSGSGLLFPIYEYYFDRQGWPRLRPNWEATEVRHAFLSNELKLRLLPLKSTREAHDALLKISVSRGGYGWGGDEIYKDLFYSIGRKPEYIVTGFGIQQWFRLVNLDYSKDLKERYTVAADFYKPADLFGPAGSDFLTDRQIIFETTEKAMSLRSGKADLATGCLTLNIAKYRKHINDYDVKVNMNSYIEQLKVNMREFNKTESAVNVACGRAFNILQIGGAEVSNTLK